MGFSKKVFEEIREAEQASLEGDIDALAAYAYLDDIEKAAKAAKSNVQSSALDIANNYPEKTFDHLGRTFETAIRKVWDFKHLFKFRNLCLQPFIKK